MTHTPGPWTLNTQDTGMNDSGTILGAGIVIIPYIYGRSKDEADANAALIAAAPDLLRVLRVAIHDGRLQTFEDRERFRKAAREAIRLAEGQEPPAMRPPPPL